MVDWFAEPRDWRCLASSEKINIAICRAFEEQGVQFSLPMRIAHTSIDSEEQPLEEKLSVKEGGGQKSTTGP